MGGVSSCINFLRLPNMIFVSILSFSLLRCAWKTQIQTIFYAIEMVHHHKSLFWTQFWRNFYHCQKKNPTKSCIRNWELCILSNILKISIYFGSILPKWFEATASAFVTLHGSNLKNNSVHNNFLKSWMNFAYYFKNVDIKHHRWMKESRKNGYYFPAFDLCWMWRNFRR